MTEVRSESVSDQVDDLIPYENNPKNHPANQIDQIVDSINEWGWTMPLLIDDQNNVIAGHGRLLAAKKLGINEVPCIVAREWSDEKKKAYCIADNKLTENSTWSKDFLKLNFEFLIENELNNYTLIDVRTIAEYEKGTIPGALNYPLDGIRNHIDFIKNLNRPIIIFCQKGLRGYLAELILNHNNINNVVNVAGGFKLWQMFSDKIVIPEPVLAEVNKK